MPPKFAFPIREALWTPLSIDPLATPRGQGPIYQVIARLKPGVSLAQAKAQASAIASQLEREFPDTNRGVGADVMPYAHDRARPGDLRAALHDARRRHRRAADRVRERVEPARRARVAAPARGGGAHGARRRRDTASCASTSPRCSCSRPSAAASASCSASSACAGSRRRCRSIRRRSGSRSSSTTA